LEDLIVDIALVTVDMPKISRYVDDVMDELALSPYPPVVEAELVTLTSGTAEYAYPTKAKRVIAGLYCDDASPQEGRPLAISRMPSLEAYNVGWSSESGDPEAMTFGSQDARNYRLYPTPATDTGAMSFDTGLPFGEDMPDDSLTLVFSMWDENDIPDWVAYVIAFRVLAKEFTRPSDHQDIPFAALCVKVANVFFTIAGLGDLR
jgi:hypothetical protein